MRATGLVGGAGLLSLGVLAALFALMAARAGAEGATSGPSTSGNRPAPSIALLPNCGDPGGASIRVVGASLPTSQTTELLFNPGQSQQPFGVAVASDGSLDASIQPKDLTEGVHQAQLVGDAGPVAGVQAQYVVPCPPPCPASGSQAPATGACRWVTPASASPSASPSASASVAGSGSPSPSASGQGATPSPTAAPAPQSAQGPAGPTVTLTPTAGPPGTVVRAQGGGFPAKAQVQLAWSQGIVGTTPGVVTTDGNGSFDVEVPILPHDQVGSRVLTAVSVVPPGGGSPAFTSATFLVVPGDAQLRDLTWRR